MREDMFKVIVERPRIRAGANGERRARNRPLDELPFRQGMARAHSERKTLNENLAPLRRFLAARVGRPWSRIHSEISAGLSPRNAVQQHVRDHLEDFVAVAPIVSNGRLYVLERFQGLAPLEESWREFYVHPTAGILLRNRAAERLRRARKRCGRGIDVRRRELDEARQLHKLNGCWFEVRLSPAVGPRGPEPDVVRGGGLSGLPPVELYGRCGAVAVAKRQLSRRELRAFGLRNGQDDGSMLSLHRREGVR
jgi:hypothetical protein